MLIFELGEKNRTASSLFPECSSDDYPSSSPSNSNIIPKHTLARSFLRTQAPRLPALSELQVVRHFTQLSQKNFSIDTNFYPLGSCTMKYNPKAALTLASLKGFINHHPLSQLNKSQGIMQCLFELQEMLKSITGMKGVSLTPMAGAQGEFAGILMIRAYHHARSDFNRDEMLVPDSAHGTNPASAVMCGYKVKEIPTNAEGDLDLEALQKVVSNNTAGIMLTNPSTLGLFERQIEKIADIIHQAGGLLYYDGANLNAILGKVKPADMGFDVMHINLHKTFATPHGGGGPGSGPLAVNEKLLEFLPIPRVDKNKNIHNKQCSDDNDYENVAYVWLNEKDCPKSIGRLSCFMGNVGILLRAYIYIRLLGPQGLQRVAEIATLNANYLMKELMRIGFTAAYPERKAAHEFILTFKKELKQNHIKAMDFAKRLLDFGIHAPTTYFPLLIPECWLIEPTETETKQTLDHFISVMEQLLQEAKNQPEILQKAPHSLTTSRLDDIKATRQLDVNYFQHMQEK